MDYFVDRASLDLMLDNREPQLIAERLGRLSGYCSNIDELTSVSSSEVRPDT